jgi:two-component system sensor histidine kinase BaeS
MRTRLILSFALIVLLSVSLVVVIARQGASNEVQAFMFRGGMNSSNINQMVTTLEAYYSDHQSWQGVESLFSNSAGHGPGAGMGAGRGQGQGNAGGNAGGSGIMSQGPRMRLADAQGKVLVDTSGSTDGALSQSEIANAIVLQNNGRTVGYLLPAGAANFSPLEERFLVNRLSQAALTAGLIAGGVSLLAALFLAYRLTKPVRALTQAARRMASGDLSQRVVVQGKDELGVLGTAFNQMANSLQKAAESRRAMTADIAHELRTPLAVQRANLEALQDGIYPLTPDTLESILEQNQMLTRLVDDLRTLALADAGELRLELVSTDLPRLVQRNVDRFASQAAAHQVTLRCYLPDGCPAILMDALRIEQVLGNLISNALRHTPPGGTVNVRVGCQGGRSANLVTLEVQDSGEGIPAEALDHLFERFYRADTSRSRAAGGTGLGLAIARQLVEAHGGRLEAANHPQGGAVFTLSLPVKPEKTVSSGGLSDHQ